MNLELILEIALGIIGLATAVVGLVLTVTRWVTRTLSKHAEQCRQDNLNMVRRIERMQDDWNTDAREDKKQLVAAVVANAETMRMVAETNREVLRHLAKVALVMLTLFSLGGCGSPAKKQDPPAKQEVTDLDQRIALAHQQQAEAAASGDANKVAYEKRLAEQLISLRDEANQRAKQEQAEEDARAVAEQKDADARGWAQFTKWIGLAGIASAVLFGGLIGYIETPAMGIKFGLLVFATALACQAWGEASPWLLPGLGVAVLGAAAYLVFSNVKTKTKAKRVTQAATAAVDKIRGIAYSAAAPLEASVHAELAKVKLDWADSVKRIETGAKA